MLNALVSVEMSLGRRPFKRMTIPERRGMWWGWTASRRVRRRSSVSLAYRVSWAAAPACLLAYVRRQPRRVHLREHHRGVLLAVRKIVIPSRSSRPHSLNSVSPFVLLRVALTVITIAEVQGQHERLPDAPRSDDEFFDHFRLNSSGELWPLSTE